MIVCSRDLRSRKSDRDLMKKFWEMFATEIWIEQWSSSPSGDEASEVRCQHRWLLFLSPGLRLTHQNIPVWHRNEIGTKQTFTLESHQQGCWDVNKGWTLRNGNLLATFLLWQPNQQNVIRNTLVLDTHCCQARAQLFLKESVYKTVCQERKV